MRILITLLGKELRQIFRNRMMLPIIFVVPLIQMIVLVYTASLDMKNIEMVVVDQSRSEASRRLVSHFEGSPFFIMKGEQEAFGEAEKMIIRDQADVILRFAPGFEEQLINEKTAGVQLVVNAINATEAGLINAYCNQIITSFNQEIKEEWFLLNAGEGLQEMQLSVAYWYNPLLDYKIYMLSGILVIVVTIIGMFLTAINLVIEKELGTAE